MVNTLMVFVSDPFEQPKAKMNGDATSEGAVGVNGIQQDQSNLEIAHGKNDCLRIVGSLWCIMNL